MPRLDHVAIEVADVDRAIQFYTEKMGFRLKSQATNAEAQEVYCFLESEGTSLELISDLKKRYGQPPVPQRPYCPHICFATDDMAATLKQLRANGIEILHGPLEIAGEETWVYFADPDGNVLEYIQWYK